jgi:hypothetical protein
MSGSSDPAVQQSRPTALDEDRAATNVGRPGIAERLLTSLDDLVRRHRALARHGLDSAGHVELHAELIATEVEHQLVLARNALHRG